MELKERMAQLRAERGLSLRQLRDLIEAKTGERMAVSYLSTLERVGGAPSIDTLSRIAAGYEISLAELIGTSTDRGYVGSDVLPVGLEEFWRAHSELTTRQIESLAQIEYRGVRPETPQEWEMVFDMLGVILKSKVNE